MLHGNKQVEEKYRQCDATCVLEKKNKNTLILYFSTDPNICI